MKTNDREIQIYYNPENSSDRKCVAHARSMALHIKTFAFAKTPSAFPNPTSGELTLSDLPVNAELLLVDALGRRLEMYSLTKGNLSGTTNASLVLPKGLTSGCYTLVELRTGWTHRFLLSKSM